MLFQLETAHEINFCIMQYMALLDTHFYVLLQIAKASWCPKLIYQLKLFSLTHKFLQAYEKEADLSFNKRKAFSYKVLNCL